MLSDPDRSGKSRDLESSKPYRRTTPREVCDALGISFLRAGDWNSRTTVPRPVNTGDFALLGRTGTVPEPYRRAKRREMAELAINRQSEAGAAEEFSFFALGSKCHV
jgi:hypothetical protein